MTSNLIPEQRMDKTGKLVTRHVRANKIPTAMSNIPAPSVTSSPTGKGAKVFKPRPKQLEPYLHPHRVGFFHLSDSLAPSDYQEKTWDSGAHYGFTASDVEVYDVFAAVGTSGDALYLLSKGVRTFDEAKAYLEKNASHLFVDRRDTARRALEKNISSFDFIQQHEYLKPEHRESEHVVDLVRFSLTPLEKGMNGFVRKSIANGAVSFDDISAIGITRLKSHDKLNALSPALAKLNAGTADYTVEDIRALIDRASAENVSKNEFRAIADFLAHKGTSCFDKLASLESIAAEHSYLGYSGDGKDAYGNLFDYGKVEYAALMREKVSLRGAGFSYPFYEAGIPVEKAIEVVVAGGGIREAIAIHEHNTAPSVAGGWL